MDNKVLVIDTDSQGNISTSLGMHADEFPNTLVNLMIDAIDREVTADDIHSCIYEI